MMKKFISCILSFLMVFSFLPVTAFATESASDSGSNISVGIEASEPDENGIIEVTVTVTPKDDFFVTAYTLAVEYDSNFVIPDMDNDKSDLGIKLNDIEKTDNFNSNYFKDNSKDIFLVTDVNPGGFNKTVEQFSVTYFFEETDLAKSDGGENDFKLSVGKTSTKTVLFFISGNSGKDEVFVDSLSTEISKSVVFPINKVELTGKIATPVKNTSNSTNLISSNKNVDIEVLWSPALINNKFATETIYTATINITPKSNCMFADSFSAEKITGISDFSNWEKSSTGWTASKTFEKTGTEGTGGGGSTGGGGGGAVEIDIQKPFISVGANGTAVLSEDGTKLTITADEGYVIKSVTLNGIEKGEVSKMSGLKTGDKVVITFAAIEVKPDVSKFSDVKSDDWFFESVSYVLEKGLMNGVSETEFAPNLPTTRAMLMTILARNSGADTDVDITTGANWYDKALNWAKENGISDGTNPEQNISREQLATMLWRFAGEPGTGGILFEFKDADKVSDYAKTALSWAVEKGIMNGKGDGILDPVGNATRAEMGAMLMRFCEL